MAVDQKKRQRLLAEKAAKRKAKTRQSATKPKGLFPGSVEAAPVYECFMLAAIFEIGIGNIIISRKLSNGDIAAGVFLVDVFCLGVKNVFFVISSLDKYEAMKVRAEQNEEMVTIDPAYARKLVEEAVLYAKDLGFTPHKDYKKASKIFGSIDSWKCEEPFSFGKDNMPYFVSGPNDSPLKCKKIVDQLEKSCGEGNFHFTVTVDDFLD